MAYGGIEAGGTKWVCAVGDGDGVLTESVSFPTTEPQQTLERAIEFFATQADLQGIGVAAFGPVDVRRNSAEYGHIAATPKPGWAHFDLLTPLRERFGVPVAIDTDVNAAALAEGRWGSGRGLGNFVYVTVGTGIGGGLVVGGQPVHGLLHPELGHMRIPHNRERDPFPGCCPFHGDCLEGLASGEAMRQRHGIRAEQLQDDAAWELEADYLASAFTNIFYTVSTERIIVGGGVPQRPGLLEMVRERVRALVAGYPDAEGVAEWLSADEFIVAPGLEGQAGALGAIALVS